MLESNIWHLDLHYLIFQRLFRMGQFSIFAMHAYVCVFVFVCVSASVHVCVFMYVCPRVCEGGFYPREQAHASWIIHCFHNTQTSSLLPEGIVHQNLRPFIPFSSENVAAVSLCLVAHLICIPWPRLLWMLFWLLMSHLLRQLWILQPHSCWLCFPFALINLHQMKPYMVKLIQ